MPDVRTRTLVGEIDLQAIVDLVNVCEGVDQVGGGTSVPELWRSINTPSLDRERSDKKRDICLWEDSAGSLIGFAQLLIPESGRQVRGLLRFSAHPDWRGSGLQTRIIECALARMQQVGRERGVHVELHSRARDDDFARIAWLESHGFTLERRFLRMARSLEQPIPQSPFPEGFALRESQGDGDADKWTAMFNESFVDTWNHIRLTTETRLRWLTDLDYKPELDLVAVAPDRTYAAFCFCNIRSAENSRTERREGWIELLGTRRGFRRGGLGKAMLLAGLQHLRAHGATTAVLGVDADSPSRAAELYESVGFRTIHSFVRFGRAVEVR